jgi:UPF0042 nucleotide-binding protein
MKLILVTGMSGAGKSVALRALEDAGFEAIDNLPLGFLPVIAGMREEGRRLAVAADIRSHDFSPAHFSDMIRALRAELQGSLSVIFLDCDDEVLQRRFTETRRRHPLAKDRPVTDGIHQERAILEPLRPLADLVVDTTDLSAQDLRRVISAHVAEGRQLAVTVTSFSFRRGLPREADLVFDVRFLKNPHYDPALRNLTGRDAKVGEYVTADPDYAAFFGHLSALIVPLLPRYLDEGKSYLTVAVGCTGGRHRSVFVAERLAELIGKEGYAVSLRHRDLDMNS